jgi:hypothetical protein
VPSVFRRQGRAFCRPAGPSSIRIAVSGLRARRGSRRSGSAIELRRVPRRYRVTSGCSRSPGRGGGRLRGHAEAVADQEPVRDGDAVRAGERCDRPADLLRDAVQRVAAPYAVAPEGDRRPREPQPRARGAARRRAKSPFRRASVPTVVPCAYAIALRESPGGRDRSSPRWRSRSQRTPPGNATPAATRAAGRKDTVQPVQPRGEDSFP